MANLQRLLTRRPHIDEAELEDVRERTMARLARLNPASEPPVVTEPIELAAPVAIAEAVFVAPGPPVADPEPVVVKTGPRIIVPRSIQLGPPEAAPVEVEPHRPPIIVTGEVEPEAAVAGPEAVAELAPIGPNVIALGPAAVAVEPEVVVVEPEVVESEAVVVESAVVAEVVAIELEAVVARTAGTPKVTTMKAASFKKSTPPKVVVVVETPAVEPEPIVEPAIVVEAVVVEPDATGAAVVKPSTKTTKRAARPKKAAEPKAGKAKSKASETSGPASLRAERPAEGIPVVAQPTPVIETGAGWTEPTTKPKIARRDPSLPVPRYAAVADDWDTDVSPAAAVAPVARSAASVAVAAPLVATAPTAVDEPGPAAAESEPVVAEVVAPEPVPVIAERAVKPTIKVIKVAAAAAPVADPVAAKAHAEPVAALVAIEATPARKSSLVSVMPVLSVREYMAAPAPVPERLVAEPAPVPVAVVAEPAKPEARPTRKAPTAAPRPRPQPVPVAVAVQTSGHASTTVAAFCPYCALALDPAPTASRRCTRCRQRIVVKRVQSRVVYLTEAAVEVFESERRRSLNFGRWSKERAAWLKLAGSARADAGRIGRIAESPLSEQIVASAKNLYLTTVDREFREAKQDYRWEDASQSKRAQAAAMHRLAGSPVPPTYEVTAVHRDAITAELRGIGRMAKDAALVGSDCCDACRADDGRTYKIATELRTPRLPHEGCPRGLCQCRWDLTLRDRTMVQRYLKRTVHAPRAKAPTA